MCYLEETKSRIASVSRQVKGLMHLVASRSERSDFKPGLQPPRSPRRLLKKKRLKFPFRSVCPVEQHFSTCGGRGQANGCKKTLPKMTKLGQR